jgi:dolichol-phosphate mannosyltransferase
MTATLEQAMAPVPPAVSVVVPVRDEGGNVTPLQAEIAAVLDGRWAFEVIFVNDGSADSTGIELRALVTAQPFVREIRHSSPCGQSAAVRSGVAAARAPIVVTLDGDGQNDPKFIPALVRMLEEGPARLGLVAGQRVGRQSSAWKRLQSSIANRVRRAVLRDGTRDTGCGLKAFRRDVFLALPYFDGQHRFLPALVRREGYDVGYVDVIDRIRRHGRSHYGMWGRLSAGLIDLAGVWWLIRRRKAAKVSEVRRDIC